MTRERRRRWILAAAAGGAAMLLVAGWLCRVSLAYSSVREARSFDSLYLGPAPSVSGPTLDFQLLLRDPRGRAMFADLAAAATPAGKVYGLCGLYLRDRERFAEMTAQLADRTDPVLVRTDCLGGDEPLAAMIAKRADWQRRCEGLRVPLATWGQAALLRTLQRLLGR